jgi:putative hydrolase of the HAD superfamily
MSIDLIAFDADDTLWHNERLYDLAQDKLEDLLSEYVSGEVLRQKLYQTEVSNLGVYGYGIKGFTLSMIETAVKMTNGEVAGEDVLEIIGYAKDMLTAEVELFEHVESTLRQLSKSYPLMVVTKGELKDQQYKLSRSGIEVCFQYVEIVSEKTREVYEDILRRYEIPPRRFLMVGNSLRSDITPVLALGGYAVYIPYHITWMHETMVKPPVGNERYYQLEHMGQLPQLIARLDGKPVDA